MSTTTPSTAHSASLVPEEELAPGRSSSVDTTPAPSGAAPPPASGGTATTPTSGGATTVATGPEPKPVLPALKEIVTAAIGVAIVFVTLLIAWRLFTMSSSPPLWTQNTPPGVTPVAFDPFQRGKDILLILLPLAGAIVGYYTGRVIADRTIEQANQTARTASNAAAQAQSTAATAQTEATQAQQAKEDVKADAERMAALALRDRASREVRRDGGFESLERSEGGGAEPDAAEEIRRILRRIRER